VEHPDTEVTVSDLIAKAREGDREAFGTLAAAAVDRLFTVAVRILHDHQDAEDAVQSALVDAWRDIRTLRDDTRFDAWLYRLLVRACYEHAGRRRRFAASVVSLRLEPVTGDEVARVADRDQIERAFKRLPIDHRAVVVLHHYMSMPLTDTAAALGIPVGTARSRLHYALKTLRAAIEADSRVVAPGGNLA
jgi:RNA polymerase sigma factor (sigma-70 family)